MSTYHDAHLVVAAIRVLESTQKLPPTADDLATLLKWHPDQIGVVLRTLEELGAIHAVTSPFDTRYEVQDHTVLESIDRDDQGPGFADELAEFQEKSDQEKERLAQLFSSGETEAAAKRRVKSLDDEFSKFKQDKPKNPFGD